jgi:hypothetical protein
MQVLVEGLSRLIRELKPHRQASLPLAHSCAIERVAIRRHVLDANSYDVTTAQFAVDRQVEQREIPFETLDLQLGSDRPHMARPQWRLGADELTLIPDIGSQICSNAQRVGARVVTAPWWGVTVTRRACAFGAWGPCDPKAARLR